MAFHFTPHLAGKADKPVLPRGRGLAASEKKAPLMATELAKLSVSHSKGQEHKVMEY